MLENKEQEKIAGIISDFFDGAVNEADIDILAMKIYEKYVAKLEQDLEFTTKTANELIEIKHKLEQELAELKEKLSKATQFETPHIERFALVRYLAQKNKPYKIVNCYDCYRDKEYKIHYCFYNVKSMNFKLIEVFDTEQEAQAKLKEIQGNE